MQKPVGIALLAAAISFANAKTVVAQAGSTGGTIGKPGKSVSGGEEQTTPSRRPQRPADSATPGLSEKQAWPKLIRLNMRVSSRGDYSAMLRHVGGNVYEATWNAPIVSRMTVTMTQVSMTVQRQNTRNTGGHPLYSETYSGTKPNHHEASQLAFIPFEIVASPCALLRTRCAM